MATEIEKIRFYEMVDEQTTIVDEDVSALDKNGYARGKKYTFLTLWNYIKDKIINVGSVNPVVSTDRILMARSTNVLGYETLRNVANYVNSQVNSGGYTYTEVSLDSTDILSLNWGTGFELLPAPDANKYYSEIKILAEFTAGTVAYDFSALAKWLDFYYALQDNFMSNDLISGLNNRVGFINIPLERIVVGDQEGNSNSTLPLVRQLTELQSALELYFGTTLDAQITNGDGTLLIKIWYKTETFGANV